MDGQKDGTEGELARAEVGIPYGHVAGHNYHDVTCTIDLVGAGRYRVDVSEVWGHSQGYDEESGRREVSGYGSTVAEASDAARRDAETSGMDMSWVVQALGLARRQIVVQ
jgi:hypothetical protein